MTPEKLATLIDLYGSAVEDWPDHRQRTAALELLRHSQAANSVLRRARGIERCLRPPADDAIDAAACERLFALTLERARHTPQRPPAFGQRLRAGLDRLLASWGEGWLSYGVPATAALVLGLVVGHVTLDQTATTQTQAGVEGLMSVSRSTERFEL